MKRILFVDTYYPDFVKSIPIFRSDPRKKYDAELQRILDLGFGTSDSYSRHLRALGWDCVDVIANHGGLAQLWAEERRMTDWTLKSVLFAQIAEAQPDIIFMQDLSFLAASELRALQRNHILAGQCSCPMPNVDRVQQFDLLLTSFPHYVEKFSQMGVNAHYVPLAFDETMLNRVKSETAGERIHDCVFIGGVGTPSHWNYGMQVLDAIAREIPTSKFWGYGYELLPESSPIRQKWQGPAWGLNMMKIYAQSKIVVTRHGEVAQGYTNNMRVYESTGMGAALLTEQSKNLNDFFQVPIEALAYASPSEAVEGIKNLLRNDDQRRSVANSGQFRTLRDHTYAVRMKQVSEILKAA